MTWKHVTLVALAIVLVMVCGRSTVCSAPGVFQGVITLATIIVSGVAGNANMSGDRHRKLKPKKKEPPKS